MLKYVIKNDSGEWLEDDQTSAPSWTTRKEDRYSSLNQENARFWARKFGAKVYRVRRASAKRERRAVVKFIGQIARAETSQMVADALNAMSRRIRDGEHRMKNHGQVK